MLDLCENFTGDRVDGDDNECYVKLQDDQWVIGKCSDKRQGIFFMDWLMCHVKNSDLLLSNRLADAI